MRRKLEILTLLCVLEPHFTLAKNVIYIICGLQHAAAENLSVEVIILEFLHNGIKLLQKCDVQSMHTYINQFKPDLSLILCNRVLPVLLRGGRGD